MRNDEKTNTDGGLIFQHIEMIGHSLKPFEQPPNLPVDLDTFPVNNSI